MARKDIAMTDEELHEFLVSGHTLMVSTMGKNGFPHLAPMWYVVENGKVVFRSFTRSQKMVNLRREPKLTVLVERGEAYADLQGVMIQGTARLVADRDYILRIYGRLSGKYAMVGDTPVVLEGEALEAAFGPYAEKNTAVVVEPEKIVTWDHRKLGGAY